MPGFHRNLAITALLFSALIPALAATPYPNTSHFGVPFSKDEPWYKQCMQAATLTAGAAPATPSASQCNPSDLYYTKRGQAVTSQAEWNQVRQCAIVHEDDAVLMMLYANGFGVQRDTNIAIHYACSLDFAAKAEMEARIEHLANLPRSGAVFDQCDDITSGYMGSVCAELHEHQDKRVRNGRLDRVARTLAPAARNALARLRAAAERYAAAGSDEVDMQGTAAPAMSVEHEERLREQFMQAVLDVVNNRLPPSSPEEFAQRDRDLNARYQDVINAPSKQDDWPDRIGDSTISHKDVRDTERLWLNYRDAFVAFRAQLASGSDANAIKTLVTGQRSADLAKIALYR